MTMVQIREEQLVMVQASNGDWLRRSQPMRHVRREAQWALQEGNDGGGGDKHAPTTRLPIVGGVRADVSLLRVGASRIRCQPTQTTSAA